MALLELRSIVELFDVDVLQNVENPVYFVLRRCYYLIKSNLNISGEYSFLIDACLDRLHEIINIGHWKDVDINIRYCITVLSYYKVISLFEMTKDVINNFLVSAFEVIDKGLLFGAPIPNDSSINLLHQCAYLLNRCKKISKPQKVETSDHFEAEEEVPVYYKDEPIQVEQLDDYDEPIKITNIERISCPALECFYNKYFIQYNPVILTDCMKHWPALKLWQNMNYILDKAGHRMVPVEVGSKYTDPDWTQKLILMREFIQENILKATETKKYLAQHQLFKQIPELRADIKEPDYCCLRDYDNIDLVEEEVDINAWFGPSGTVSPLHFDPKHNLLAQVVGSKEIVLYSPDNSDFLYPHPDNMLQNTSQVDPTEPDIERFPNFPNAHKYHCVLNQGEMLYIPPKWWHYVKSLSTSFSVSFWWS